MKNTFPEGQKLWRKELKYSLWMIINIFASNNPFSGSYLYAVRDIHQELLSSLPCLIVTSHHQHTLVYKSCFSVKIYNYVEEIQSQIKKLQLTWLQSESRNFYSLAGNILPIYLQKRKDTEFVKYLGNYSALGKIFICNE